MTKFSIFPHDPLANLNILYIIYVTFVNQCDSTQHPNFGSTPQIVYFCSFSFKISYPATHHWLTHTLFAVNCRYLTVNFQCCLTTHTQKPNNTSQSDTFASVAPLFLYWYSVVCVYFRLIIFQCYHSNLLHIFSLKFYHCVARHVGKKCVNLLF